jgi:hypothetical protein
MKLITTSIKRETHQGSVVKKKTLKHKSPESKWEMKGEHICKNAKTACHMQKGLNSR